MGRGAGEPNENVPRRPTRRRQTRSVAWVWTDDAEIERALRQFTDGCSHFPTRREFDRAGKQDLRCAVTDYGGCEYWATRLGLALTPRQQASRPYSDDDAVADARNIVADGGHLPGVRRLRAAGYGRLATKVQAAGGALRFRRLHELD